MTDCIRDTIYCIYFSEFKKTVLTSLAVLTKKLDNMALLLAKQSISNSNMDLVYFKKLPVVPVTTLEGLVDLGSTLSCEEARRNLVSRTLI